MDIKKIIDRTQTFVKQTHQDDTSGHDFEHIKRVHSNALRIAEKEGGDLLIINLAALLHDMDDWKITGIDRDVPVNAINFMQSIGLDDEIIAKISNTIKNIGYRESLGEDKDFTLEEKIIYDADKLDSIGAIGIARAMVFAGHKKSFMFVPDLWPIENITKKQYCNQSFF